MWILGLVALLAICLMSSTKEGRDEMGRKFARYNGCFAIVGAMGVLLFLAGLTG